MDRNDWCIIDHMITILAGLFIVAKDLQWLCQTKCPLSRANIYFGSQLLELVFMIKIALNYYEMRVSNM